MQSKQETEMFMTYKTFAMCTLQKLSRLTSFVSDRGGWSALPNSEYRITDRPAAPPQVDLPLCPRTCSKSWEWQMEHLTQMPETVILVALGGYRGYQIQP